MDNMISNNLDQHSYKKYSTIASSNQKVEISWYNGCWVPFELLKKNTRQLQSCLNMIKLMRTSRKMTEYKIKDDSSLVELVLCKNALKATIT
jgi:hypothetical protein